jgi:dTDP-glucose 4,6-dehydratase
VWGALRAARLFVTGGTGFVGKWLVESLLWANDRLDLQVSAVLLTRDPERFCRESPHLANHDAVELRRGRVAEFDFPSGEFPFVIHAATERYFVPDEKQPASTFDLDVEGTRRVLEFARTHGSRRLLFTSSGVVYGRQPPDLVNVPEDYPGAPLTTDTAGAYGQAKRVSEFLCAMYASQFGFVTLIARLFAFVGPYLPLDQHYAVGNFIRDALAGGPIRVRGDGTPYRSYLYAGDLAVWLWTILIRGKSARPYNVGSDEAVTIAQLASTVADSVAPGTPIVVAEEPVAGARASRYVPSVERAKSELGLCARLSLPEGVRRTVDWERRGTFGAAGLGEPLEPPESKTS